MYGEKIAGGAAPIFWENRLSYVDYDFFLQSICHSMQTRWFNLKSIPNENNTKTIQFSFASNL